MATMNFGEIGTWAKTHPLATGAIVFGGGLGLLYLLGYIGGGSSSAGNAAQANGVAAFYAAEAAQAGAGAAIEVQTLQSQAATAQAKIAADAATAITGAQANRDILINGQNTGAAYSIAGLGLQGTLSNNATALASTLSNNATQESINANNTRAGLLQTALNTVIPIELNRSGSAVFHVPGDMGEGIQVASGNVWDINSLVAMGYSPTQAQSIAGVAGK
jgi:hypothetical protein